jgi:asparagine synthase (glutamine-hydrolysing)
VPIYHWLRGPLRDWAESLLDEQRLEREGYLNPMPVRSVWQSLLTGRTEWEYGGELIWSVLMFQAWLEHVRQDTEPKLCDSVPSARPLAS